MNQNVKTFAFINAEGWEEKILRKSFPHLDIVFLTGDSLELWQRRPRTIEILSNFIRTPISTKELKQLPNLRFIAARSTGFDHIDLRVCKKRGIKVANVPGYGENTVAEYTFGLILSLLKKIHVASCQTRELGSFSLAGLRGYDLQGKTLAVLGTGRIGKNVIKIARGFGMKIVAYDPFPDKKYAKYMDYEYKSLDEALSSSDIITLHMPYNRKTHHLINDKKIRKIKKGAFLINTARGGVIGTNALVKALKSGILAGAALDVLEEEGSVKDDLAMLLDTHPKAVELKTLLENHALMKMPNVLITPHNAFNTEEAVERILETTIENIQAFLRGKPINVIN